MAPPIFSLASTGVPADSIHLRNKLNARTTDSLEPATFKVIKNSQAIECSTRRFLGRNLDMIFPNRGRNYLRKTET